MRIRPAIAMKEDTVTAMLSMQEELLLSSGQSDPALQHAVACGQKDALTVFVLRYQSFLKSQCRRLAGGNHEEAGDLFSLVLLKICSEHPEQFRQITHLGGWLVRIAQNKSIDMQRSRQAEERRGRELAQTPETGGMHSRSPEQTLLGHELVGQIQLAFELLPARLRDAAELRLIDEASYETIAHTLGISQANARKRVQEARRCLAQILRCYLGEEPAQQAEDYRGHYSPDPAWDDTGADHA
jgi:RNA polymerase sigma factor (sigma-70 family)